MLVFKYIKSKFMLIKKEQSQKFTIAGGTKGRIYPSSPENDFTVAEVKMEGVYPEKGYSINDVSKESLFLLEGNLKVEIEGEFSNLNPGDLIIVYPGKKYRIEGKGKVIDLITPAWEKNKNQIIKK
jgi:mannose-6-phosphate isomerase-like protein (cupin superfamily)